MGATCGLQNPRGLQGQEHRGCAIITQLCPLYTGTWRLHKDWTIKGILGCGHCPTLTTHLPVRAVGFSNSMPCHNCLWPLCSPANMYTFLVFQFLLYTPRSHHPSKHKQYSNRSCATIKNEDLEKGQLILAESLEGGGCWVPCALHQFSLPNSPRPF